MKRAITLFVLLFSAMQLSAFTVSFSTINISCYGGCNGSTTADGVGGVAPYTYSWSNPVATTQTVQNLCAGTYTVTVMDATSATATATVMITSPLPLTATSTSTAATCGNPNGTATAIPSGGTGAYTYVWNSIPSQTSATASGLLPGTYTCTVTDMNACTILVPVNVANQAGPSLSPSVTNCSCFGMCDGALASNVTGGNPPYTYLWSNNQTTASMSNLCAGTYNLAVTDANGCTGSGTVTVTEPPMVNITITPPNASICAGSNVTLTASGATTYMWSVVNFTGNPVLLSPTVTTTYTVTGMAANGCYGTNAVTVIVLPNPTATWTSIEAGCNSADGSAAITATGNGPFSYTWVPMLLTGPTAINLPAGSYTVDVTDINGCVVSPTVIVDDSCDFVWPGDADDDAVADNNDILAIGIANSATGTSRLNATLNWIGQPSAAWGQTLANGTDYKWVDCNGDGVIDPADTNAVIQNFGFTHNNREGGIPVYNSSLPDLAVTMGQTMLASNSQGTLTVAFGSSVVPVANFYGLAFTLNFDPTQIDASTFSMNENGTWMGIPGNDLMGVVMNAGTGTGQVQVALTRLDHQNSGGFGTIANMAFMTTGDLVGTGTMQNVNFTISDVTVIDANETQQTVNMIGDSVLVADPVITGIIATDNVQQLSAYPNPFSESVQINLPSSLKGKICEVILTDAAGRIVSAQQTNGTTTITIERGTLERGIYFCSVRSEGQLTGITKLLVN
jgi:hypothetical protein